MGILTGDIVSENPLARDWDEVDHDLDSLGLPIHFAVGNHDIENRPLYENRYGSTFYQFTLHDDLFIVLDPNLDNWNISRGQLEFVRQTLLDKQQYVNNIFVFFHQLLWIDSGNLFRDVRVNSFAGRAPMINFWTDFLPLFDNVANPIVMFAGDLGAGWWSDDVMYYHFSNKTFIASGMGEGIGDNYIIVNSWSDQRLTFDIVPLIPADTFLLGDLEDHSIEEPGIELELIPNPASDEVSLRLSNLQEFSNLHLFDMRGSMVLQLGAYEPRLNLEQIPAGLYIIAVEYEDKMYRKKLMVR